ncbi:MAG: HD domain-containing protein [Armatimonadetes bacterium]|nr:HD domain-containing protein [Armatimonadota bacterium]
MHDLARRIAFIEEADKLRGVLRLTRPICEDRRENSAEHSWHIALIALVMQDHAPRGVDINRVLKMLIVHDLVEIDVGDIPAYETHRADEKEQGEEKAAKRLFGMLPEKIGDELQALWREFEDMRTPDAKFANAIDRYQPMMLNDNNDGDTWVERKISRSQVLKRAEVMREGCPGLHEIVTGYIDKAVSKGHLKPD